MDRNLALELVRVTEAAALVSSKFMGRGDKNGADGAAVEAMRKAFESVDIDGEVVIGEGELDEAPMLYIGEKVGKGTSDSMEVDIAVDPLDGTRPFIRGIPTHSVLIALEENHEPVIGVIHLPAMNITCWGAKNSGAFLNGEKISVSKTDSLYNAIGSALGFLEKADQLEGKRLLSLMKSWNYNYGFMDAYSYVAIASGKLDICLNLLD